MNDMSVLKHGSDGIRLNTVVVCTAGFDVCNEGKVIVPREEVEGTVRGTQG